MSELLAIDPGPEQSAYVAFDACTRKVIHWAKADNPDLLRFLSQCPADHVAIEMIASYGMPVGREVFETCVWIGRFMERLAGRHPMVRMLPAGRTAPIRITRSEVKSHLCHSARANDATVRQALIDRYGPGKEKAIGRKATPGPLYGLSGDGWAALAVAVTVSETRELP